MPINYLPNEYTNPIDEKFPILTYPLTAYLKTSKLEDDCSKTIQAINPSNSWNKSEIFIDKSPKRNYKFVQAA